MDALRRSTLELWQYFDKLSFNTLLYSGPAVTHPSVFLPYIPEYPVRRRGSLHFWHFALDHFLSKNTGLVAKQGTSNTPTRIPCPWSGSSVSCRSPAHSVNACLLPLPPFGCRCFLQPTFPLEASN